MVKGVIFKITLLILSVVIAIVIGEMAIRLFFYGSLSMFDSKQLREPHPTRGWALKPNIQTVVQSLDYTVRVKTNPEGFSDKAHKLAPSKGVTRVVVLGDSFMEAYQVDFDKSFCSRFQQRFNADAAEVINLGVGGYGTIQELITLQEVGLKYQPNFVVLFFSLNDVVNNHEEFENTIWRTPRLKTFSRPYYIKGQGGGYELKKPDYQRAKQWAKDRRTKLESKQAKKKFYEKTLIYKLMDSQIKKLSEQGQRVPKYDPNVLFGQYLSSYDSNLGTRGFDNNRYGELWSEAWDITFFSLQTMSDICKERGIVLIIATVPNKIQVDESFEAVVRKTYPSLAFDLSLPNRTLESFAEERGILFVDLLPIFKKNYEQTGEPLFHKYRDRHWNEKGHEIAADAVFEYMQEQWN